MDFVAPIVAAASAQTLARLHVRAFTMSVEPATLRVGETLTLRITARLDENVLQLDNVTLPDLAGFESLGDERRCGTSGHGSVCVETMTLTPTEPGDRTIAPATLEATDGRTGKPSRFATNSVVVHVTPLPQTGGFALWLLESLGILAVVAIAGYALLWGFRRREPPQDEALQPERKPAMVPLDRLAQLLASLRDEPSRARALAVREELRRRADAREGETLGDLLARGAAGKDGALAEALRAVEPAVFVDEPYVAEEVRRALPVLERLLVPAGARA
jgi:hypothetical protein